MIDDYRKTMIILKFPWYRILYSGWFMVDDDEDLRFGIMEKYLVKDSVYMIDLLIIMMQPL